MARQIYVVGVLSAPIIIASGVFIGFVLGLQYYVILSRYGQTQFVGTAAALTLYRELGPVLTALLFIGCAGTAMTASIGLKKAGEQLDAMDVMAVDPIAFEIAPRFWATVISVPLLTMILLAIAVFGTYLMVVVQIGIDYGVFWGNIQAVATFFGDVTGGLLKSLVFGIATALIALFQGYHAVPTPDGVSRSTTRTVIIASVTVLGLDFILTAFLIS